MRDPRDCDVDDEEGFVGDKIQARLERPSKVGPNGANKEVFVRRVGSDGRDQALQGGRGVVLEHELVGVLEVEDVVAHNWLLLARRKRHLATSHFVEYIEPLVKVGLVEALGAVRVERLDKSCHSAEVGAV